MSVFGAQYKHSTSIFLLEFAKTSTQCIDAQLIGMTNDFGLEQVVREPTRIDNILDLLFTSNPTLVERSYVVPGISDHDGIPIVTISCKPRIIKQVPRKIYMYHKTDLHALKIDLMKWRDE